MRITDEFGNTINSRLRFFGGAKVPPVPKDIAAPAPPTPVVMPTIPAPQPIPPAPTTTKLEVQQAADDQRAQAASRNGLQKTIMAGDTGGYGTLNGTGKKTLLG